MEHKIGEVFEDGGVKLKVEKSIKGCDGCAFQIITGKILCAANGNMEDCRPSSRKDHTNVIFVKVNNNKDMETRNIKLDLKTAKEWFKGSDKTLKKLALQAYKEEELKDSLPNSWEEFCDTHDVVRAEYKIDNLSNIVEGVPCYSRGFLNHRNLLPSKKSAEAHLALMQLEQLRDCYRNGWEPDYDNIMEHQYVIYNLKNAIIFNTNIDGTSHFLSFQTKELCEKFYDNFKDLIETAKDLI